VVVKVVVVMVVQREVTLGAERVVMGAVAETEAGAMAAMAAVLLAAQGTAAAGHSNNRQRGNFCQWSSKLKWRSAFQSLMCPRALP
jgi:hypothetical protein